MSIQTFKNGFTLIHSSSSGEEALVQFSKIASITPQRDSEKTPCLNLLRMIVSEDDRLEVILIVYGKGPEAEAELLADWEQIKALLTEGIAA